MIIKLLLLLAVVVAVLWLVRGGRPPRHWHGATRRRRPRLRPRRRAKRWWRAAIAACTCRAARHCRAAAASSAARRTVRPSSRRKAERGDSARLAAAGCAQPGAGRPVADPALRATPRLSARSSLADGPRAGRNATAGRTPPKRPARARAPIGSRDSASTSRGSAPSAWAATRSGATRAWAAAESRFGERLGRCGRCDRPTRGSFRARRSASSAPARRPSSASTAPSSPRARRSALALLLTLGVSRPVRRLARAAGAAAVPRLRRAGDQHVAAAALHRPAPPPALARLRSPQWLATIGVDIVCFTALHVLEPVAGLNYGALLVLPVLMAGVLTPRLMALATAAAVTLGAAAAWPGVNVPGRPATRRC